MADLVCSGVVNARFLPSDFQLIVHYDAPVGTTHSESSASQSQASNQPMLGNGCLRLFKLRSHSILYVYPFFLQLLTAWFSFSYV
jgi:hypothetical protein